MRGYRRSRADYPQGVIGIYDNRGQSNESADHYLVVFAPDQRAGERPVFSFVSMSDAPFSPQGVCLSGESVYRPTGGWQSGPRSAGKTIDFADLPGDCKRAVYQNLVPLCSVCFGDLGSHFADCTATLPYIVGEANGAPGEQCKVLGRFETEHAASTFIGSLPDAASGRYYLDGPGED